jgi:hypothetical protein
MLEGVALAPIWLIDMALARSVDELRKALEAQQWNEIAACGHFNSMGNAMLGYYFLQYRAGTLSMEQFLQKAGEEADSGSSDLKCETVYELLNRTEATPDIGKSREPLIQEMNGLFITVAKLAEEQWHALQQAAPEMIGE